MVATVLACVGCGAAYAQPLQKRVFGCSFGTKSVSVTAAGGDLHYMFGAAAKPEIAVTGNVRRGNVFYREDRFAGIEHQLRFTNGAYSYIVYNMEGNPRTGASAVSGLVVMKGTRRIADFSCTRYAEFGVGFDLRLLPADTGVYSAM